LFDFIKAEKVKKAFNFHKGDVEVIHSLDLLAQLRFGMLFAKDKV